MGVFDDNEALLRKSYSTFYIKSFSEKERLVNSICRLQCSSVKISKRENSFDGQEIFQGDNDIGWHGTATLKIHYKSRRKIRVSDFVSITAIFE